MRRLVLKVHLYLLLACSGYLIFLGASSLLFNHPIDRPAREFRWEQAVSGELPGDPVARGEQIREALGLFGWVIPWETRAEADGRWVSGISRPGRHYALQMDAGGSLVRVVESRKGLLGVLHYLHGGTEIPGSWAVSTWAWYTRLSTVAVVFAAISGLYLFATRRTRHAAGWAALVVALGLSAAMFVWMLTGA